MPAFTYDCLRFYRKEKMADGKKNRFSALSGKDKCDETECQSLEQTVAEAVEEALNNENDQKPTVSAKQPTRGKKKTWPPSTTPTGQDGAMIIKSVTTAVTAAVATAFKHKLKESITSLEFKFDVIALSESWLSDNDNYMFCLEGYDILSCSRLNKKGEE